MQRKIITVLILTLIFGVIGIAGSGKISEAKTYYNATISDWNGSKIYFAEEEGSTGEYGATVIAKVTKKTRYYKAVLWC